MPRDRALVVLLLFAGLADLRGWSRSISAIMRVSLAQGRRSIVRSGKRDAYREVPLNALARQVLTEWLEHRKQLDLDHDEKALCISRARTRLSARAADASVRRVANDAGLELSGRDEQRNEKCR